MTSPLRVVHINNADVGHGGAALAAYRLHHSLRDAGVESSMRVAFQNSGEEQIRPLPQWPRFQRYAGKVMSHVGLNDLVGLGAFQVPALDDVRAADVLHLHLLEGNYFSYPALARITRRKPAVLTLHDMWQLTGHCSYSYECERWRTGCGSCPHLEVYPVVHRDMTAAEWRLKSAVYARSDLSVVAPSKWLAGLAEASMLGRFPVHVIPYGIDTQTFSPRDAAPCREALGVAEGEFAIGMVSASIEDKRKGADLLVEAVQRLDAGLRARCVVLILGWAGQGIASKLRSEGVRVLEFDYLRGDAFKAMLYAASDVFVLPTRADNSPLVVIESMACGTPCIAFDVGGLSDTVRHDVTGLLAPAEDAAALAHAVGVVASDPSLRERLGRGGRALVLERHEQSLVARLHIELYEQLRADRHR